MWVVLDATQFEERILKEVLPMLAGLPATIAGSFMLGSSTDLERVEPEHGAILFREASEAQPILS